MNHILGAQTKDKLQRFLLHSTNKQNNKPDPAGSSPIIASSVTKSNQTEEWTLLKGWPKRNLNKIHRLGKKEPPKEGEGEKERSKGHHNILKAGGVNSNLNINSNKDTLVNILTV